MNKNFRAGVVSVTLRQHAFVNFIKHTANTDLTCIEWGSDIHVPYNAPDKAADVAAAMRRNNLATASYGSYYKLGRLPFQQEDDEQEKLFEMVLDTAKILNAPMIRVWGGERGSADLNEAKRREIADDAVAVAAAAQKYNISVSVEYHQNTITDTPESALDFIHEVREKGGDNLYLYWQTNPLLSFEGNADELRQLLPFLSNIHVLAHDGRKKLLLREHRQYWEEYIKIIKSAGRKHDFLIEFTKDNSPECLTEDAKTLVELLENS